MAYKAEIAVDVKGLKAVRTLESSLNKISGKISAINKISIGNSKAAKIEEKVAKSKEAQRVSMIQTRRVGDAVQRAADKGLQTEKALAAVKRAAKADAQGALKVSIEQRKIALEELKAQQQIAKVVKDKTLTGFGPKSPVFGRSTQMDSAGNTAAILQDPTTKVSPVQQALEKMEKRSERDRKQAVLNRKKSLSLGKDIVRIKTREANLDRKRVSSLTKETKLQKEIQSGKFATLRAGMQGPALPPVQGPAMGPTSMGLNFDKRTGKLLRGPAGSGGGGFRNLGRRFDRGSALISGGFPLLFGQGPVTAAAGALGGGIGGMFGQMGGFAGGIAATAAVTSIQNAINGIGELGKAMNRLNPNISAMSQAMGIAGTVEEKRLQLIEQNLGKQAAYNAALEMLGDKIGPDQAEELRKFGETFQRLGNEVTLFFTKVQAAIAKLLNQALGDSEGRSVQSRATKMLQQNPNNPAFRDINKQIADLQAQRGPGGGGRGRNKELNDQINALNRQKRVIAETVIIEKDKDALRVKNNKLITAGLSGLKKEDELNKAIIAGKEEEFLIQEAIKNKAEEMGLIFKDLEEGQQKRIEDAVTINRDLKEQAENAKAVRDAFESIAQSIGTDIKDGIAGLIKGTSTLGDLLNNVADKFLDMALNQALFGDILGSSGKKGGGILGFLTGGKLAKGGRAAGGKSFLVGEKGPELFVPRSTGTVVPNNKLAGGGTNNVVVNVDASGSDVQGDDAGGQELGALIAAAVQGELVKQQRPGGILNR